VLCGEMTKTLDCHLSTQHSGVIIHGRLYNSMDGSSLCERTVPAVLVITCKLGATLV